MGNLTTEELADIRKIFQNNLPDSGGVNRETVKMEFCENLLTPDFKVV